MSELDYAVSNLELALKRASLCGYATTVKEEREAYIRKRWSTLESKLGNVTYTCGYRRRKIWQQ